LWDHRDRKCRGLATEGLVFHTSDISYTALINAGNLCETSFVMLGKSRQNSNSFANRFQQPWRISADLFWL
jgi:hypothetical protein